MLKRHRNGVSPCCIMYCINKLYSGINEAIFFCSAALSSLETTQILKYSQITARKNQVFASANKQVQDSFYFYSYPVPNTPASYPRCRATRQNQPLPCQPGLRNTSLAPPLLQPTTSLTPDSAPQPAFFFSVGTHHYQSQLTVGRCASLQLLFYFPPLSR